MPTRMDVGAASSPPGQITANPCWKPTSSAQSGNGLAASTCNLNAETAVIVITIIVIVIVIETKKTIIVIVMVIVIVIIITVIVIVMVIVIVRITIIIITTMRAADPTVYSKQRGQHMSLCRVHECLTAWVQRRC